MERKKDRGGVRERVVDRGVLELVDLVFVDVKNGCLACGAAVGRESPIRTNLKS